MFVTKIVAASDVPRGMGATVTLPLLDAMVPALTVPAQTAAAHPPFRRDLHAARRDDGPVDAGDGGRDFEFTPTLSRSSRFVTTLIGRQQPEWPAHRGQRRPCRRAPPGI